MKTGTVIGTVWATRKEARLAGLKLLVVQPVSPADGRAEGMPVVAADIIGAGVGETVLYVGGSAARGAAGNREIPVDMTIVGIVDGKEIAGR